MKRTGVARLFDFCPRSVARFLDVRPGEARVTFLSFVVLTLISAAHAVLEAARDGLLVTHLKVRSFGVVYIAVAACALPASASLSRFARGRDTRQVLGRLLALAAGAALAFTAMPQRPAVVVAFYVTVALIASAMFPQFWVLVGARLTVAQSRRLMGPIASAGVIGAVVGAAGAAGAVTQLQVSGLMVLASGLFALAAGATALLPPVSVRSPPPVRPTRPRIAKSMNAFRDEPFLLHIAVLVALTTATALVIDYFFKSTVARSVPAAERGAFIARYYAVVNALMLLQLLVGGAVLRGLGVPTSMVVTPLLSLLGGIAAFLASGFALPALLLKGADGSLRSSINRMTTELVYLPVSSSGRERAKPVIDGALVRIVQALAAGSLLAAGSAHKLTPRVFCATVVVLSAAWLMTAIAMRRRYLAQLRRSIVPALVEDETSLELDLASIELLVETLGSDDPAAVLAAMSTLARRRRERLIPALVLRHPDARVLRRALEIFGDGSTDRGNWVSLASALVEHADDGVRIAAVRALAAHGRLEFARLEADGSPAVRGYGVLHAALERANHALLEDAGLASVLQDRGPAVTGLLMAVADAEPSPRVAKVLFALAELPLPPYSVAWAELIARASVRQGDAAVIPALLQLLVRWEGRESIRAAIVALGPAGFAETSQALADTARPRRFRAQLPQTLGRFGSTAAAAALLERVEHEADGLVRYKSLRALGRLVADRRIRVDRIRIERCMRTNLVAYFTLLGTRVALGDLPASPPPKAHATAFLLLAGVLDDKVRQSLERAFRLLKIAYPDEDLHRVYLASIGADSGGRASAGEFLDALMRRRRERELRELVRLVADDLAPREKVQRAANLLHFAPPASHDHAVQAALGDDDLAVASLAAIYAVATGARELAVSVAAAREKRPSLELASRGIVRLALPLREA